MKLTSARRAGSISTPKLCLLKTCQEAWRVPCIRISSHHINHSISLCTCERAAENGAFGSCFRQPFHHSPTRTSGRFNLFLGSSAPSAQRASTVIVAHVFDIHSHSPSPPPPLSQRDLFWLHELCPQNGHLSIYPAHHGSRYI
jgi:hypothetical protein